MSEESGIIPALKKWLEFGPEDGAPEELTALKEELAMEEDPKKQRLLKKRIKELESEDELAKPPTPVIGTY